MTNLEGRVLLPPPGACAPPAGVRTDLEILAGAGRAARARASASPPTPREVFEELRRASAGGNADYAGITLRAHRRRATASSGPARPRTTRARRACSPTRFADRGRAGRGSTPVQHRPPAEEPDDEYPLWLTTGRVHGAVPVRRPDPPRRGAASTAEPEPVVEIHPRAGPQLRHRATATWSRLTTRRGDGRVQGPARRRTSGWTRCSSPSTGAAGARQRADQRRARPGLADAGVQGLRGPHREGRCAAQALNSASRITPL